MAKKSNEAVLMFAIIKFISKKNKDSHKTKIIKIHNFTHWKTLFAISYLIQEKRKKKFI